MRIAILSDIHDNVWNLAAVLDALGEAEAMICCGDLCSPFVVTQLAEGFKRPIHVVFGNNDGDQHRISRQAAGFGHVQLHGELFQDELGGRRIIANHYPSLALRFDPSGFDLICYGHDHTFARERRGDTLIVNPGTVMGFDPIERREVPATFVLYDTAKHQAKGFALRRRGGGGVVAYP